MRRRENKQHLNILMEFILKGSLISTLPSRMKAVEEIFRNGYHLLDKNFPSGILLIRQ